LDESQPAAAIVERRPWLAWAAAAAGLVSAALLAIGQLREAPPQPLSVRFEIPPAVSLSESGQFSVSPNGRHFVFAGTGADGILRLWVRSLDALETRPLLGTEAEVSEVANGIPPMFWSPDDRFIAFYSAGQLKKVDVLGGSAQTLCDLPGVAVGGSWNRDDVIIVGNTAGGLMRCSAAGGTASPVTIPDGSRKEVHLVPSFLPDGRHFLYLRVSRSTPANNGVYVGDLEAGPDQQRSDRVLATGFGAAFVPADAESGQILFVREQTLFALPFNGRTLVAAGEPFPLAGPVGSYLDTAFFAASSSVLIYRAVGPDLQLTWLDRQGHPLGRVGEPGRYTSLALSPDASQVVVSRENRLNRVDRDLWLVDVARNTSTRFTSDPALESAPAWSADGTRILFTLGALGVRGADLYHKPANGLTSQEVLLRTTEFTSLTSASADGRFFVMTANTLTSTKSDLWLLAVTRGAKPVPLVRQEFDQTQGQFSPDGRWIAYVSNESGANEVFLRPLTVDPSAGSAAVGGSLLVSRGGGTAPRWRADGKELFYLSTGGTVMAVDVAAGGVGTPTSLFRAAGVLSDWGVTRDGQRFLFAAPTGQSTPAPFTVVLNWRAALKR
jgi:Tol biopolymer transport system component